METIYNYDRDMETRKWSKEIPYLKFPSDWEVKIIPPFGGATIRFVVKRSEASVSVYLDCYSHLGSVEQPYWEIYPYEDDTARYLLNETDELIEGITHSLNDQLIS